MNITGKNNVKLDTVREGVQLLSGLLKTADQMAKKPNDKISNQDVRNLNAAYGDGAEFDAATLAARKFSAERLGGDARRAPSMKATNKALSIGMKAIAKAGSDGELTPEQYAGLAPTWQKIVDFSVKYEGQSLSDLMGAAEA